MKIQSHERCCCHLGCDCSCSSRLCSFKTSFWFRLLLWVEFSRPVVPRSLPIFLSRPGGFLRGGVFSWGSGLGSDEPLLGEGGSLSTERVRFEEEQLGEEPLLATRWLVTPRSRGCRPSLSLLLELMTEQTSWRSSHRTPSSWEAARLCDHRGASDLLLPRRCHRSVCRSQLQLGLMAQKSSMPSASSA